MTNAIAAVGEVPKPTGTGGLNIILDIAAFLSAIVWPLVLLIIALTYRKEIPGLVRGLANRLSKLQFAGISIELPKPRNLFQTGLLELWIYIREAEENFKTTCVVSSYEQ